MMAKLGEEYGLSGAFEIPVKHWIEVECKAILGRHKPYDCSPENDFEPNHFILSTEFGDIEMKIEKFRVWFVTWNGSQFHVDIMSASGRTLRDCRDRAIREAITAVRAMSNGEPYSPRGMADRINWRRVRHCLV